MNKADLADAVAAYYASHENEWSYSLTSSNMNPESTGTSNCSALIWHVAHILAPGSDLDALGYGYTGVFASSGRVVQTGVRGEKVNRDLLEPLDMLLVDDSRMTPDYDHVELYLGDHGLGSELWGAGSAPLPHRSPGLDWWTGEYQRWAVIRFDWGCVPEEGEDMTNDCIVYVEGEQAMFWLRAGRIVPIPNEGALATVRGIYDDDHLGTGIKTVKVTKKSLFNLFEMLESK